MKDRLILSAFVAASLSAGCVPIESNSDASASALTILGPQFAQDVVKHDVIIIGELHGTKEVPDLVAKLSERMGNRTLFALELRPESSEMTCPPGKIAMSWQRQWADGRSSKAMLAALCNIRSNAEEHNQEVLLIDSRSATERTFYAKAAATISAELDSDAYDRAIVLTGNFHSRRKGDHLAAAFAAFDKEVITATMSAPEGTAWNCTAESCGIHETSPEFCKDTGAGEPNWTADVPDNFNWDRCLTFPSVTASPPADERPNPTP